MKNGNLTAAFLNDIKIFILFSNSSIRGNYLKLLFKNYQKCILHLNIFFLITYEVQEIKIRHKDILSIKFIRKMLIKINLQDICNNI